VLASRIGSLNEDVQSGRLQLDPAAGEQIRSMLAGQMQQVDTWLDRARGLARRVPLGQNPVGEAMAGKFEDRAGGENSSFAGVFTSYRQVLQDAHDTMGEAMRMYGETEQKTVDTLRKLSS
jgi:hypothetical protein